MLNRREAGKLLALAAGAFAMAGKAAFAEENSAIPVSTQHMGHSGDSVAVHDLMSEPLAPMPSPEVTMLTLTLAPGSISEPHKHTGPVFAYILEGSIENQVDPGPAKRYNAGDFFYEPPMHVHRQMKNLSATKKAKVLVVQVGEKGKEFTISA
jgi:quercetin dioxygenase-like cupin family protein